jgi:hypothetical protein
MNQESTKFQKAIAPAEGAKRKRAYPNFYGDEQDLFEYLARGRVDSPEGELADVIRGRFGHLAE